jgi:hypothetical protein
LEGVTNNVIVENKCSVMLKTLLFQRHFTYIKIGKKLVSIGENGGFVHVGV